MGAAAGKARRPEPAPNLQLKVEPQLGVPTALGSQPTVEPQIGVPVLTGHGVHLTKGEKFGDKQTNGKTLVTLGDTEEPVAALQRLAHDYFNGGKVVDTFELLGHLGEGMDAKVVKARRKSDKQEVALKMLPKVVLEAANRRKLGKLLLELSIWQKIKHPSVLKLLGVFHEDAVITVECELCNGGELFDQLESGGLMAESDVRDVCFQIASGLGHLHIDHHVAHRDIKSANILCRNGHLMEKGCVKLADFGFIAGFTHEKSNEFRDNCGTLEYFAPELCENMLALLKGVSSTPPWSGPPAFTLMPSACSVCVYASVRTVH